MVSRINNLSIVKGYNRKDKVLLFIFSLVVGITGYFNPILYKMLIDDVFIKGELNGLYLIASMLVILFVIETVLSLLKQYYFIKNNKLNRVRIKLKIIKCLFGKDIELGLKHDSSKINMSIEEDVDAVSVFMTNYVIDLSVKVIYSLIYFTLLFFVNFKLLLMVLLIIPVNLLISIIMGYQYEKISKELWEVNENKRAFMFEVFQKWKEVKSLCLEEDNFDKFVGYIDKLKILSMKWMVKYILFENTYKTFRSELVDKLFLYFVGGLLIIKGQLTIGSLVQFMAYFSKLISEIDGISMTNTDYYKIKPALERITKIIGSTTTPSCQERKKKLYGDINFKNVSYKYSEELPVVLDGVNIRINACQKVAICAASGRGKTTLVKLLLGVIKPTQGEITVDGINIDRISAVDLHKNISSVMQEHIFFNLSIRENLYLAKMNATEEELICACKKADIMECIENLPEGFDTIIGENGIKLSGGQKQRLAIARVLLTDSPIMIFDEATSSLDSISASKIYKEIIGMSNKTIVIISHRLPDGLLYDKIIKI